jgi:hypothetical protein
MTSSDRFNTFAAARGEGLHPRIRDLLERATATPSLVVAVRHDGMLQAGPSPLSEMGTPRSAVTSFSHEEEPAAAPLKRETQTPRRRKR